MFFSFYKQLLGEEAVGIRVGTIVPILDENVIINSFFLISQLSADTFLYGNRSIIGKLSMDKIADTDSFF
jgi:hypothetical protein